MCMSACAFETFCGGAAGPQKRTIFDVCIAALARAAPLASRLFLPRTNILGSRASRRVRRGNPLNTHEHRPLHGATPSLISVTLCSVSVFASRIVACRASRHTLSPVSRLSHKVGGGYSRAQAVLSAPVRVPRSPARWLAPLTSAIWVCSSRKPRDVRAWMTSRAHSESPPSSSDESAPSANPASLAAAPAPASATT